ncbi:MAG: ribosome assembly factor SBDS [Candidatus Diapherotrites archaeon]|jgi:ribosome maturation protein SDO1|uniref:Ribosome assembly factor SBDS n=1 Tax=Candidatus Iainarchaeum sp. TaxID=3101447 RepID=A0A8T5GDK4_9ARCH|nr:ribosome assembly factor SBDS [Candidatus Diapherotrites archaeon]MBT7241706.1 ribosome assembly factor SBDS [Candidatus Diapherotrites archaeon]
MVKIDDAVIARMEKHGHKYEVLVDPDLAMNVKHGKEVDYSELLAADRVFKDSKAGEEQSPEFLKEQFETDDINVIAKKIITDGDVQLTTEQRRHFLAKKKNEIITMISRNAVDPQSKTPHPPQRIENAMEQAKIHIDAFKSVEEQVNTIVDEIKKIIPISMDKIDFAVKIPAVHAGRCSAIIHKFEIKKEQWLNDGSLVAEFFLPVGMKQDILNELNSATHGEIDIKIIE